MNFEIKQDTFGFWHYRLRSGSQVLTTSNNGYTRRSDAVRAVKRIQEGAAAAGIEFV